jgi:hypothetical protein
MNSYEATKIWTEERVTIAATVLQVCSLAQNTWDRVLEDCRGCSRVAVCDDLTSDVSRTRSQGWLFDAVIRAVQSFRQDSGSVRSTPGPWGDPATR